MSRLDLWESFSLMQALAFDGERNLKTLPFTLQAVSFSSSDREDIGIRTG